MRVLGLTGGIGSGKSTVARRFAELGATVIDADQLAREVVEPGTPGLAEVVETFGPSVLDDQGRLDRRALGRIVFEDEAARRRLEALLHPRIAERTRERLSAARAAGAPLVVHDVPLLFERPAERGHDAVAVVWASLPARRGRIGGRDELSPEEIDARIASQIPLEDKVARADHVLDNDGPVQATLAAVDALYAKLTEARP